jgi:hypothetical protein
MKIYPVTLKTFFNFINSSPNIKKCYTLLGSPLPNDVSLRDGLQGITKEQEDVFHLKTKKEIYREIMLNHYPRSVECGSIVSPKIYPIFNDTIILHSYMNNYITNNNEIYDRGLYNYVFIPNHKQLLKSLNHNFTCFSFVTSPSEGFLLKNIKQTLQTNYQELASMVYTLDDIFSKKDNYKTKIYVSCINECPIEGKIQNKVVVDKILELNKLHFDSICLSDTCGTLTCDDFVDIVDNCNLRGIPYNKFSLHLHVDPDKEKNIENIIHNALDRKIIDFDVSILKTGGCSITIDKKQLKENLSYELYYKSLVNYFINKCEL